MLYPVLLATVVQYITEPCIQGVMATLVGADRQGSLQASGNKVPRYKKAKRESPLCFYCSTRL